MTSEFLFRGLVLFSRRRARCLASRGLTSQAVLEHMRLERALLRRLPVRGALFTCHGLTLEYPYFDTITAKLALVGGHEFDVETFIDRRVGQYSTVLDVGANLGYFSLLCARHSQGTIVAFEPGTAALAALRRNVSLNNSKNLQVVPKAVWSSSGLTLDLRTVDPFNRGANSLVRDGVDATPVETVSLDDFTSGFETHFDILKIDVEGAEKHVLAGAVRLLSASPPRYVLCAFDSSEGAERLEAYRILRKTGFQEVALETEEKVPPRDEVPNANLLFRRATPI